jgi:hypothetical protein
VPSRCRQDSEAYRSATMKSDSRKRNRRGQSMFVFQKISLNSRHQNNSNFSSANDRPERRSHTIHSYINRLTKGDRQSQKLPAVSD